MKSEDISVRCLIQKPKKVFGMAMGNEIIAIRCFKCDINNPELMDIETYRQWKKEQKDTYGLDKGIEEYAKIRNWSTKMEGNKWIFVCNKKHE